MISDGFDIFFEFLDGFGQVSDTFATVLDSIQAGFGV